MFEDIKEACVEMSDAEMYRHQRALLKAVKELADESEFFSNNSMYAICLGTGIERIKWVMKSKGLSVNDAVKEMGLELEAQENGLYMDGFIIGEKL